MSRAMMMEILHALGIFIPATMIALARHPVSIIAPIPIGTPLATRAVAADATVAAAPSAATLAMDLDRRAAANVTMAAATK